MDRSDLLAGQDFVALLSKSRTVVRTALPLTPDAMTLKLVLLYRDLLAAAHAARTEPPKAAAL